MQILNKHKATPAEIENAIYIGRGSPLGNPYVIGVHGKRDEVIEMYRYYLYQKVIQRDPAVEVALRRLNPESVLLCFCTPKNCHGTIIQDVVLELLSEAQYEVALEKFRIAHEAEVKTADFLNVSLDEIKEAAEKGVSLLPPISFLNTETAVTYNPDEDGITHINVWSKGRTELGRLASNFAHTPFIHPEYGHFSSVEAFWYWLSTGKQYNELRSLYGFDSKKAGRILQEKREAELRASPDYVIDASGTAMKYHGFPEVQDFVEQIKKAILCKVEQNERFRTLLKESTLPLAHYYVWGNSPNYKVSVPQQYAWTWQYIDLLREWLNGRAQKLIIAGSREIDNESLVEKLYEGSRFKAIEIVSGCARGIDTNGEALARKLKLPIARFPADWKRYENAAGAIRNAEMGKYADAGLIAWNGSSAGTANMISVLTKHKKPCRAALVIKTTEGEYHWSWQEA